MMERKHMRFLTLLVSLLVLVSLCATTAFAMETDIKDPVCYYHGDVNGDGAISKSDALYVLYYSMLGDLYPDRYPVTQDFDFSDDDKISKADALYLLYASFGEEGMGTEQCPLNGLVHEYYDPFWTWNADEGYASATLTFRCGCRQKQVLGVDEGLEVTSVRTEATCVAAGKVEYTAKVTFNDEEYTDTYTVVLPVSGEGHQMVGEQTCDNGIECQYCDYELPALGHSWVLNEETSTAATCQMPAVLRYECECGDKKEVTQDSTLSHTYQYVENGDHLVEGTTCTYVKTYQCSSCEMVIDGTAESDVYDMHVYEAALTKEADCHNAGEKTYTCTKEGCNDSYTEEVAPNGTHLWDEGTTAEGVITYQCKVDGCSETKTSVAVTNDQAISNEQLTNELQLENANVSLDAATVAGLDAEKEIKISVEPADLDATGLSADQKKQVGDNTVYDFSMAYTDGTAVTEFAGKVTVSLPYELKEGEDIDSIDIWYIDNEGNPARMTGTYSNGFVTFETDHFSYYTVTRLTTAERCARYGHIEVKSEKAATCTADGYNMSVCQRCGEELSKTVYPMLGHSYKDGSDNKAATCTEAGMKHQTCERCDHVIREEIPETGHKMVEDQTRRVEATCATAGQTVEVCDNGCGHEQVKETAQLAHSFENSALETVYPDCTNGGYDHQKCDLCGEDVISNQKSPLGHNFAVATENGWNWNEDMTEVEINLVCRNNDTHTKTIKATITKKAEAATCTGNGGVTYTAIATFNGNTFTKTVTVPVAALGHQASGDWQTNAKQHYRICGVCGEKADAADHTWGEKVVNKQATCVEAGSATYTCNICGYVKNETLPATGKHNLVDGKCSDCGFAENTCDHVKTHKVPVDLSAYDICGDMYLTIEQCECGMMSSYEMGNMSCDWEYEYVTEDGRTLSSSVMTCTKCGFIIEESWYTKANEDSCTGHDVVEAKFSVGEQIIAETYYEDRQYLELHPFTVRGESVDLKQFGLCGGTMTKISCSCGEAYWHDVRQECDTYDYCDECNGTIKAVSQNSVPGGTCVNFYIIGLEITVNDEVVHTYEEKYPSTMHDYVVDSYEMEGTSCEDGVRVISKCADCGTTYTRYMEEHSPVMETIIDLTGYGSCAPAVTQSSCICGQEKAAYEGTFGKPVEHDWINVEESETEVIATCSKCNYTVHAVVKIGDKDEECNAFYEATYTLSDGKGHTYSYEEAYFIEHHSMKQELVLLGSKCTDGVEAKIYCVDCGHIQYQELMNEHIGQIKDRYDLSEYGMCGEPQLIVFECLCGEQSGSNMMYDDYSNTCNWNWMSGDEYSSKRQCTKCGVIWETKTEVLEKIDDCHQKSKTTHTFSKDDQKLVDVSIDGTYDTHAWIYSFELKNPSEGCDGGYDVHLTCSVCGETNTWYDRWGHEGFPIDRELVSVNQLCGDLEIVTYSCACGMDVWTNTEWTNGRCNFQWDGNAQVCTECGAVYTQRVYEKPVEGESCKVMQVRNVKIDKNGKNICDYSSETVVTAHNEVVQYNLLGETCDDGYTYTYSCATCGELLREVNDTQYGCNTHAVEVFDVAQSDEICGPVKIRIAKCACGKKQQVWQDWSCSFSWHWDEKNDREVAQCTDCGMVMYENTDFERIPGTCTQSRTYDYRFELNDTVIGTFQGTYVVESHDTVATYQMFGATCDDGYYVTWTCVRCGHSETWEDWGHCDYQTGYYNLADYGMCGGEYYTWGCACGKYSSNGWNYMDCDWEHKNHDDATGTDTYYCSKCNTYRYVTENGQRDPATCIYTGTETIAFERNDEVLLSFSVDNNYESHAMVVDSATLLNPDGNCEDGVTVMQHCEDCGFTQTRTYYHHEDLTTLRVDLSDGCGGELRFGACVCGENRFFHQGYQCQKMVHTWQDWTDSDGIYHNNYVEVCPDCGLTIEDDWYNIGPEDSCEVTCYETYTVTYGSETYTYNRVSSGESHRDVICVGGTLEDGATSCEEGVRLQLYCNNCGATLDGRSEHHEMIRSAGNSIDLSAYGSYCGATLDLYSCACGAQQRYDIGVGSECDIHRQGINHWIDGVIDNSQYTSEGYHGTWSYSYLLKCAVSDPVACGLTIRMAEYWLNENCMAVEYQSWQLGYDEQTGTWEREITIPTGEKHAYHPYVTTNIDENPDANTCISGTRWTCPDCGSYGYERRTYLNDIQVKWERYFENTLYAVNGENQYRSEISEQRFVANGHIYDTLEYTETVEADGTAEWCKREYVNYDFSNGDCKRTCIHTDSDGYAETNVQSAHIVTCRWFYDPYPTCSQDGVEYHVHDCVVCGVVDMFESYNRDPNCHYWNWDCEKQIYFCGACGLESAVGASGSICMEDLTEDGESVYKIGYWNRGNINFVPKVSVILKDATTDDNELVLSGIEFNYLTVKDDGVRALTFSKDAAQQAAEAAMENVSYTGDYAIRISFVPIDDTYTLDYAITFDSLNAAQ